MDNTICKQCSQMMYAMAIGICQQCNTPTRSISYKFCEHCAREKMVCQVCNCSMDKGS